MTTRAARSFWSELDEYHDLAIEYEQNIEMVHPDRVKGECRWVCGRCPWAASAVDYYEYRGSAI